MHIATLPPPVFRATPDAFAYSDALMSFSHDAFAGDAPSIVPCVR